MPYKSKGRRHEYNVKYHAEHREERNASARKYYAARREEINKRRRELWAMHRDEINRRKREYFAAHREEISKRRAAYRLANKDKIRAYASAYIATHRKQLTAYAQKWKKANPEKCRRAYLKDAARRRARKRVDASYYAKLRAQCRMSYARAAIRSGKTYRPRFNIRIPDYLTSARVVWAGSPWLIENQTHAQRDFARELAIERKQWRQAR